MFSPEERDRIREAVLDRARSDPRVVAGALVGSYARGAADRWSDLDLAFALDDGVPPGLVLDEWTRWLAESDAAVHLLDLRVDAAVYRVLLLPGALQLDISMRPLREFHSGPGFELVFGSAGDPVPPHAPDARELFGWAVLFAIHARACIERGRLWQADYDLNALRERALALACVRRGLKETYGRGFDDLPPGLLASFAGTRSTTLTVGHLAAATASAIELLLSEAVDVDDRVAVLTGDLTAVARNLEARSRQATQPS
jgi:predicted nucleotidyltransferase